jgi:hypothetical protein
MSLKEAIAKEPPVYNQGCRVKKILKEMSEEDRKVLNDSLADEEIQTALLVRALKSEGFSISVHSAGRHRRGDCSCHSKKV